MTKNFTYTEFEKKQPRFLSRAGERSNMILCINLNNNLRIDLGSAGA
jgi:hypothetical protein